MANEILSYLQQRYKKTGFRFFSIIHLRNKFGQSVANDLNTLYKQGYIKKQEGANAPLIELIENKK